MNITGIITEYNPFHNGHLYHLETTKKVTNCDGVICIMSGNFVQRGEPAIIDKWKRTEMALSNGVDLIIELPTFYAVSSAEFFAKGAINILDRIGIVNNIFFGSECGDVKLLSKIAKVLTDEPKEIQVNIKKNLKLGITYAKARERALIDLLNEDSLTEVLLNSNNILGIEYIKAILKSNSNIVPLTMKREGSKYNDRSLNNIFSSATSIRENLKDTSDLKFFKSHIPTASLEILDKLIKSDYPLIFAEDMYAYIKYRLLTNSINFNNLFEVKEGIDNKLLKEIYHSSSYEDLIFRAKSKRYTYTKISRLLCHLFFALDTYSFSDLIKEENLYARVLGFNDVGRLILKEMKKNSSIPIITKVSKNNDNPLLDLDIQSTKAYSILNNKINPLSDYLVSPIIKQ
ncbi:MAG: nucleotidyltransferase [Clostridium sartagoforme]|nr:nucleotidyltransferase [Clostridium sartagoforme]